MTENTAKMATRRLACAAFDGQNRDDVRVAVEFNPLMWAHDITMGLQTTQ